MANDTFKIETFTGKFVNPLKMELNDIDITDIAHSLSNTCRYNGHCSTFYSVLQHSLHVSENCSDENKLWGLLHDATEAYLGDMPRPLKIQCPQFSEAEDRIAELVAKKFNLVYPIPDEVKVIDTRALRWESEYFMTNWKEWGIASIIEPLPKPLKFNTLDIPFIHKLDFEWTFKQLTK